MICQPCRDAAAAIAHAVRDGEIEPTGHHAEICTDVNCPCQHRTVTARPEETP